MNQSNLDTIPNARNGLLWSLFIIFVVYKITNGLINGLRSLGRMRKKEVFWWFIYKMLNIAVILTFLLMLWKGLILLTACKSPVVVFLGGASMEPTFYRGDLLFLTNYNDPIQVGEIVVYEIEGKETPTISRVFKIHANDQGFVKILTKGDMSREDDRWYYSKFNHKIKYLEIKNITGRVKGYLPYVGIIWLIFQDYPKMKYLFILLIYLANKLRNIFK